MISRNADGTYAFRMGDEEREVLESLMPQLRELITERDSTAWRLFPNAYQDDREMAAEYEELVGNDLRARRLEAIATVERTLQSETLSADELHAWMGATNDMRLVLGTRLDVTEESEIYDYNTQTSKMLFSVYSYLGYVLEEIVGVIEI